MDRGELEGLDRESLVVRAQAAGIRRARILTRPELIDELLRLDTSVDEGQLRRSRGFFGRARDLVARVVERGLHLPDAADRIRTLTGAEEPYVAPRIEPQAMPTVTLAEIYAAQGHPKRAIETLRRVLEREPDHLAARALLERLEDDGYVAPPLPLPPEPDVELEPQADDEPEEIRATPEEVAPLGPGFVTGPTYEDANGAEFFLAPETVPPRAVTFADHEAPAISEQRGPGPSAIIAAADKDVDALAPTGVYAIVPEIPEREAEDECFAIPLPRAPGGGRMYVRWNVSFLAIGAQLGTRPAGRFVVRAHLVTPAWDGPQAETRDLAVDPETEEVVLHGLPDRAVVRVAVGWLEADTFVPFAHSPALEVRAPRGLAIWTPHGSVPVALEDPRVASIARAWDRSRHAVPVES